jgi:two-component system chemotaxis response regulator CheY
MPTILVVDDSDSIRKLLEVTLKTRGFAVVSAADGQDALEALERHTENDAVGFNALVLDINMPRLDGLSLLTLVRARPEWKMLPILMLTTEGRDEDRRHALALGANDYMVKPFKPSELITRVMALLAT